MFHSAQHLNEVKPRDKLEGGDKEKIKAAVQKTLDWLEQNQLAEQATLEIDRFPRASATRTRCLDHASRSCEWTLPQIPWASSNWMVPTCATRRAAD